MDDKTKEGCEENGGTWMVDENGTEMCQHPAPSETPSDTPSDDSVGM